MGEYLRLARPFLVLLGLFTLGRWLMGSFGVPYANGHHVFSLVILTLSSSVFYGMFGRRWYGLRLLPAAELTFLFGLSAQVVIFVSTLASYGLGLDTYFNHPTALNAPDAVPFGRAMGIRAMGLLGNPISTAIAGAVGWSLGGLLPERPA